MQAEYKQEPSSEQQQYSFTHLSQKTRSYKNMDSLDMVKYCISTVHQACFTKKMLGALYLNRYEKNYLYNVSLKDTCIGSYVHHMGLAHPIMGG